MNSSKDDLFMCWHERNGYMIGFSDEQPQKSKSGSVATGTNSPSESKTHHERGCWKFYIYGDDTPLIRSESGPYKPLKLVKNWVGQNLRSDYYEAGELKLGRAEQISRQLSSTLRHQAEKEGLAVD